MTPRPRNPDGTFKSAFDVALEREEADWHAEIKAKMDAGLTFDEAWTAAGGSIVPIEDIGRERAFAALARLLARSSEEAP